MVTIRHCSDWIRIDNWGKVIWEGHSIRPNDLKDILGNFVKTKEIEIPDEEMEQL